MPVNATNENDIGEYPISLTLIDDEVTSLAFTGDTFLGNVTYRFKLTIYRKLILAAPTEKPPDVRLEQIFVKYNTSVIDVREFDKNAIYNATDTTLIK